MLKLKEGAYPEYKRRHDLIWDDMKEILKKAGRLNYSIWYSNNLIFGYYEVEDKQKARYILSDSDVVKRWNDYMKDLVEPCGGPGDAPASEMEMAFYLE